MPTIKKRPPKTMGLTYKNLCVFNIFTFCTHLLSSESHFHFLHVCFVFRVALGAVWITLGSLGISFCPLLAPLGCLLGLPWPLLGLSWLLLGASWLLLSASWLLLAPLGRLMAPLERLLGASWLLLGASWLPLGASLLLKLVLEWVPIWFSAVVRLPRMCGVLML